jgi:hypothetical protein
LVVSDKGVFVSQGLGEVVVGVPDFIPHDLDCGVLGVSDDADGEVGSEHNHVKPEDAISCGDADLADLQIEVLVAKGGEEFFLRPVGAELNALGVLVDDIVEIAEAPIPVLVKDEVFLGGRGKSF